MSMNDTPQLFQVTSAWLSPAGTTVLTRMKPEKAAAPGGNRGPRKPHERSFFSSGSERLGSFEDLDLPVITRLVLRNATSTPRPNSHMRCVWNVVDSLTGPTDKRTPVDTGRARVLRDTFARTDTL